MDAEKRKKLREAYEKAEVVGGIYCVECGACGKKWIKRTRDLEGVKNRYDFSISINSCPEPEMREVWTKYGGDTFTFSVKERLIKSADQSDKEYMDDLDALLKMLKEADDN